MTPQQHAALLLELANQVEHDRRCLMDDRNWIVPLADRARAAAAELVERTSEAEVFRIYDDAYVAETHLAENRCNNEGIEWDEDAVDARANRAGLRAVIARFGGGEGGGGVMPRYRDEIAPEQMTPDQLHCYQMLLDWRGGAHHLGRVTRWCDGIRTTVYSSYLATFDMGALTTLVLLAHDRCVRVELANGGPRHTAIICHRRNARKGYIFEKHPTIETALAVHRRSWPAPDPSTETHAGDAKDG